MELSLLVPPMYGPLLWARKRTGGERQLASLGNIRVSFLFSPSHQRRFQRSSSDVANSDPQCKQAQSYSRPAALRSSVISSRMPIPGFLWVGMTTGG